MPNNTKLAVALRQQAISCAHLDSAFMAQLLNLLADRLRPGTPVSDRLFNWPGQINSSGHSVPLRLAGSLHRLVLSGQDTDLAAAYPPHQVNDDMLWAAVSKALNTHSDLILQWLNSPPQTNEVRRAAALIATGQLLAARFKLPMMVSELGASAGLNLNWDKFRLDLCAHSFGPAQAKVTLSPDWTGTPPPQAAITVTDRRGVDLSPVNTDNPDDRTRLKSYIWPDQPHRMALTENAMALPRAPVDKAGAIDWLARRLPNQPDGTLHLIYHTIAWQYFPQDTQQAGRKLIENAGQNASKTNPLAWFSMEADTQGPGAALTLRLWPGNETLALGRADFHGRWINWNTPISRRTPTPPPSDHQ
ncbi:MAG: DUF2332 domain-containing protein [Paracoccaceae bacterium]